MTALAMTAVLSKSIALTATAASVSVKTRDSAAPRLRPKKETLKEARRAVAAVSTAILN